MRRISAPVRRDGLRLAKDDKACEDIDECAEGSAKCEQGCRNLDPRITGLPYICTCPDGLAVDPADQYHCIKQARAHMRSGGFGLTGLPWALSSSGPASSRHVPDEGCGGCGSGSTSPKDPAQ